MMLNNKTVEFPRTAIEEFVEQETYLEGCHFFPSQQEQHQPSIASQIYSKLAREEHKYLQLGCIELPKAASTLPLLSCTGSSGRKHLSASYSRSHQAERSS